MEYVSDISYQNLTGLCTIKRVPISKDVIYSRINALKRS